MARVRVREHVNPLAEKYQTSIAPPQWDNLYGKVQQPLHLDIGCARGRFVLKMAQALPQWNFLGLEIREPLVEEANQIRDQLGLTNLHYLFCNANNSLQPLLASLPTGVLQRVTIQFPDPWFKKRHQKRRVVQPELVEQLALALPEGAEVFLQSDVEEVALQMRSLFDESPVFQPTTAGWLETNPLPIPTEREIATLARNFPVYRALFHKLNPTGQKDPHSEAQGGEGQTQING
ncbi:tRNA (guanosine(46)-N7)-methyltransferase TrmB [Oscillatoria amoena NRMC-F 0135]|uniref:tRNA (guanine-N(7)-)-methyltransferase n=1 Tax=Geitlerinema calcuttense NRMC-F 0142 TaxID=2922238 RepID=A0ABT7LX09_9CYAN|nr:tRNA (guanosine(46)-N7)-methyltransferase TrmB [Geitlerinema calcuttense]MDI9637598.1 tRNA (guanosine(46)-N7)-methyltransferase TrmB [Geitlerinema splendidum]MDL5045661.1 tRNA (guanosine(46)-N7)-methyltransferase TrmB [Oscillatoria amoena NRMC-F 0135]MDL5056102.1 tRNA (guanosine(46)-N7)-methyltransferase TrmB [Geitlerinema calcuttense NRMC-F 0142]